MDGFERYVELASRTSTPEELFEVFSRQLGAYGYDKILFGLLNDHTLIDTKAGIGVMENYPTDWLKYYFEQEFDKIDPIVTFGAFQSGAFAWDTIDKQVTLNRKQIKCLNLGREAGLNHGISVPLRGPNNALAGISLASSSRTERPLYDADMLTAYCQHFYSAYWRLKRKALAPMPINAVLTAMERKILTFVVMGYTDADVALALNCSPHSVNSHTRHIYQKLEVNNRVSAAAKALYAGLISFPAIP